MNKWDIHAAEETENAGFRFHRGDYSDKIRAFMFAKNERRDILKRLSFVVDYYAVDYRKLKIRIVGRDLLHYRPLGEADSDNQIVMFFGKGAHCGLDRGRIAGLDIREA